MNKNVYFNLSVKNLMVYNVILYFLMVLIYFLRIKNWSSAFFNTISFIVDITYYIFLSLIFYLILLKVTKRKFEVKEYFRIILISFLFLSVFFSFFRNGILTSIDNLFLGYGDVFNVVVYITSILNFIYPFVVLIFGTKYFAEEYEVDWRFVLIGLVCLILFKEFVLGSYLSPYFFEFLYPFLGFKV